MAEPESSSHVHARTAHERFKAPHKRITRLAGSALAAAVVMSGGLSVPARADTMPQGTQVPVPPVVSMPTAPQPETLSGDFTPITAPVAQPIPGTASPPTLPTSTYTGPSGYVAGGSVHVASLDTANTTVYANPDGTHTAMVYGSPINFQANGSQVWQPINTTIIPAVNGALQTAATPTGITFSPIGNASPLVSLSTSAGTVGFNVLGASGSSSAVASGSNVDYPNILANTNLDYNVGNDFIKGTFQVLQPPPATQSLTYSFPLTFPRNSIVSVTQKPNGDYQIATGPVQCGACTITIPTSIVYDSTVDPRSGEPRIGPAYNSLTQDPSTGVWTLEVTVEPGYLDDPSVLYPIYVDPTLQFGTGKSGSGDDSFVQDCCPNSNRDVWKPSCCNHGYYIDQLGYYDSTTGTNYDYLHYDLSSLNGAVIQSAQWHAYFPWSSSTYATDYWIHPVAGPWSASAITWNNQPWWWSNNVHDQAMRGQWRAPDITGWVGSWTAPGGWANNGIAVEVGGQGQASWKDIAADENTDGSASYIQVTYDFLATVSVPASPANGSSAHTSSPTFTVNPASDPDGSAVQYWFRIAENSDGETNDIGCDSGWVSRTSYTLPSTCHLAPNRPYYWHVYTSDGTYTTPPNWTWSFTPTDNPPSNPQATSPSDGATVATTQPTLKSTTSTDPDSGDTVSYVYTVYSGADGSGQVVNSGKVSSTSWYPLARILKDGGTYYWTVQATDGWLSSAPSTPRKFSVNLGLGNQADQPYDTVGPAVVNLSNGNLLVSTALPSVSAVGGSLGVGLTYNSQKPNDQGLTGYYFNDTNGDHLFDSWKTPQLIRTDSTVDFNWNGQPPYPSINATNFLVRWTGYVTVPSSGSYQFGAISDDGSRIWIGPASGTPVLNDWNLHGAPPTPNWGTATTLAAGQPTPITIEYFQGPGGSTMQLWVSGPGGSGGSQIQAPVPASWLTTDVPGLPDGWTLSGGGVAYIAASTTEKTVTLIDTAGRSHGYTWSSSGWIPPQGEDGVLALDAASGTVTLHDSSGVTYTFNKDGTLNSAQSAADDLHPAAARYTYAGTPSRLTQVTDPVSGRSIALDYADPNNATGTCPSPPSGLSGAPNYRLCKVDYSAFGLGETDLFYSNGHLARIVNPGNATTDFGYDSNGKLSQIRDALNNDLIACGPSTCSSYYGSDTASSIGADTKHMWLVAYNGPGGQVKSVTAPLPGPSLPQPAHSYTYNYHITQVHDALIPDNSSGYVRKVVFDNLGRTQQDFDLAGVATATNTWDSNNQLLTTSDATGIETSHVYDAAHRLTDTYRPGSPSEFRSDGTSTTAPHTHTGYDEGMNFLAATWWSNKDMSGVPLTHSTSTLQETFSTLPSQLPSQNFSGRLTGEINLPQSGVYGFNLTAAGGARLYIDDQKILDSWNGPYFSAVQADHPAAYWRFGDPGGATTAQDVEQLHPGTYNNGVGLGSGGALSGDSTTSAAFNGSTNQYVSTSDLGYFGNGLTIEVWAKPASVGSYQRFVDFGNGAGADNIVLCRYGTTDQLELAILKGGAWVTSLVSAAGAIALNQWQHFVATVDTSGHAAMYKNGVLLTSGTGGLPGNVVRNSNYIGRSNWNGDAYFDGAMQEVAVYPNALSAARVLAHYQAATTPNYSVSSTNAVYPNALRNDYPLSYWRLDEPAGSTVAADTENINPGTYVNSPGLGASGALSGDPDKGVSFNGTNQLMTVVPNDTVAGAFSVEAWINPSTGSGDLGVLGTRSPSDGGFDIQVLNGKLHGDAGDGTNWLSNNLDAPTTLSPGTWYHVVYVVTPGSWTIYVNGSQAASGTLLSGTPLLWDATHQLAIGDIAPNDPPYPFNGSVDEVAVYGVALTAAQVSNHYRAGTNPGQPITGATSPLTAGAHRIRIEYQGLAAPGQLSLSWTPPGGSSANVPATDLAPRFGLVTSGVDADGRTGAKGYTNPILGLPTSTTVDPGTGHLNLTSTASYEPASASTYYRLQSSTLPKGSLTAVTNVYYGATEPAVNPCSGGAAINQAGALKSTTGANPASGSAIVHEYVYDAAGRTVATRVSIDPRWTCAAYDARGRVASRSDLLGRTSSYDYSLPDRVTATEPDYAGVLHTTVIVGDWLGRPLTYTDENGTATRTVYDQAGRVTDTYRTFSGQTETQLTHLSYDATTGFESSLTEYASSPAQTASFSYDTAGRLLQVNRAGSVVTTQTFDATRAWLNSIATAVNGTQVSPWSYQRSPSGKVQVETGNGRSRTFIYDGAGRLTQASDSPGSTRQYAYDANSNRCATATTCASPTYTYDGADRLLSSPYATSYQYDVHGNVISAAVMSCAGCATKEVILYDAHDHARWLDDGLQTTADTLTPSGRMLQRTVTNDANGTSTSTAFGYQNGSDSPAYSLSGGVRTTYIGGPGGLLLIDVGGTPTYPIENGHGDIVGGVSAGGTFTSNPDVTEFGQGATSGNGLDWLGSYERFTLPGPIGLVRMGVRFYDPSLGRFLEVDPVPGGSANAYDYSAQDPVNNSDISGSFYDGNGLGADIYASIGDRAATAHAAYFQQHRAQIAASWERYAAALDRRALLVDREVMQEAALRLGSVTQVSPRHGDEEPTWLRFFFGVSDTLLGVSAAAGGVVLTAASIALVPESLGGSLVGVPLGIGLVGGGATLFWIGMQEFEPGCCGGPQP
jgi:RHS repeat-associated protein